MNLRSKEDNKLDYKEGVINNLKKKYEIDIKFRKRLRAKYKYIHFKIIKEIRKYKGIH